MRSVRGLPPAKRSRRVRSWVRAAGTRPVGSSMKESRESSVVAVSRDREIHLWERSKMVDIASW